MGNSESRVRFHAAVLALQDRDVGDQEHEFWEELWRLPQNPEEVFGLVTADAVKVLKESHPGNLTTLIQQAVRQMEHVVEHPRAEFFGQALNCVRVLTRVLPFLLEDGTREESLAHKLFWSQPEERAVPLDEGGEDGAAESKGEQAAGEGAGAGAGAESAGAAEGEQAPLGRRLVHAVFRLLFVPDFTAEGGAAEFLRDTEKHKRRPMTAAEEAVAQGNRDPEIVMLAAAASNMPRREITWRPGIAFHAVRTPEVGWQVKSNRTEVLRLLLVMLSTPMYTPADRAISLRDRWTEEAMSAACPFTGTLFVSLLNGALAYDPVGWGVPYGSYMVSDYDEELSVVSLHVLLALLGFRGLADAAPPAAGGGQDAGPAPVPSTLDAASEHGTVNFPRYMLRKLSQPSDYAFVFRKFAALLKTVHQAAAASLPGSMKRMRFEQELLMLLWKLLDENPGFREYILRVQNANELVVPMLFLMSEGRDDPAKVGLIHMCTFILLLLSGERNFAVALNQPFGTYLPLDLPRFTGTHGDLLFIVLHKLFVSGASRLSTLYSCFLTIMANVSPYLKQLSMVTAVKVVNLCEAFSGPRFLFSAPDHPQYISFLLEIINNFIQYQYEGNTHLVYAIVRRKEIFFRLASLPMPGEQRPRVEGGRQHVTPTAAAAAAADATSAKGAGEAQGAAVGEGGGAAAVGARGLSAHTQGTDPVADARRAAESAEGAEGGDAGPDAATAGRGEAGAEAEAEAPAAASEAEVASEAGAEAVAASEAGAEAEAETETEAAPSAPETEGAPDGRVAGTRPGFVPTAEWVREWQSRLPLYTVTRLLQFLAPQVEALCTRAEGQAAREEEVITFLKSTTLVGLLPVPHPIVVRRYNPNQYTNLWFTTFLWGVVFLQNQHLPVFDSERIQLFTITRGPPPASEQ